jgi:hypothetical protein
MIRKERDKRKERSPEETWYVNLPAPCVLVTMVLEGGLDPASL